MKPKVALINASPKELFGGQERYCIDLAKGLSEDFDFTIICLEGKLARSARGNGLDVTVVPLRGNLISAYKGLLGILKTKDFKIVHSMDSRSNLLARLTFRSYPKLIRISTRHELYNCDCFGFFYYWKRKLIALSDRLTSRYVKRIIVVCDAIRREMLDFGYEDSKIKVIYNGIPEDESAEYHKSAEKNDNQIVAVGRLSQEKGYEYLIDAISKLKNSIPGVKLLIAGTGPLDKSLQNKIESLGLADRVSLLGFVDDIPSLMQSSAVLAVPSLHEAFSLVVLEGMAAGLPIVGSRIGGIPEAVLDGENGILVEAGDSKGLADALQKLLGDRHLREEFGATSLDLIKTKFRFKFTLDKVKQIYEQELRK